MSGTTSQPAGSAPAAPDSSTSALAAPDSSTSAPDPAGAASTVSPVAAPVSGAGSPAGPAEQELDAAALRDELDRLRRENETQQAMIRDMEPLVTAQREAEEAKRTDLERATEEVSTLQASIEQLQAQNMRLQLVNAYGLDEADMDLLGTGSKEELEARAQRIRDLKAASAAVDSSTAPPSQRPLEHLKPGATPPPPAAEPAEYPASWIPKTRNS